MPLSPRTVPGDRPLLRSTFLDCQPPAAGSVSYFHSGESNQGASAGRVPGLGYRGPDSPSASSTLGSWVFASSPKNAPPPVVAGLLGRRRPGWGRLDVALAAWPPRSPISLPVHAAMPACLETGQGV